MTVKGGVPVVVGPSVTESEHVAAGTNPEVVVVVVEVEIEDEVMVEVLV